MRVKDKVIIVTGAARGIGRATADLLAAEGAKVVISDRDAAGAEAAAAAITAAGGTAMGIAMDVTDRASVDAMVAKAKAAYGRIDVIINNAGITMDKSFGKMTEEMFDKVIAINLKGVFNCAQAVVPTMLEQGKGKILTTSSVVGLFGNFGQTNYVATKAAVIGMTKTWAKELGPKGITANVVAPGFIATEMTNAMPAAVLDDMKAKTPVRRLGQPSDIAKAFLFLSSDDSDFINGHTLSVDGGLVIN